MTDERWADGPEGDRTGSGEVPDPGPADLLVAALAGDRRQWDRLVEEFTPLLRSVVATYRLGDEGADAIQTTFLRLWEHGSRIRDPRALPGWLVTTARHEALRVLVRRRRVVALGGPDDWPARIVADDEQPDERVVRLEEYAVVRRLLAGLPDRQRMILGLLSQSDRPDYRRIGELAGIPTGSIGPTRHRALARLRDDWDTRYGAVCA